MTDITARYCIELYDQTYAKIALFDAPYDLTYHKEINSVGTFSFSLDYNDPRTALFELDGMAVIRRSIPGVQLDWYDEFVGLHRSDSDNLPESAAGKFISSGPDLNDFLARTIINYREGTVKAQKSGPAETVIKEYVLENCGNQALIAVPYERCSDGVLQDFEVEASTGAGKSWEGTRAFENLLDTIQIIAKYADMDFNVTFDNTLKKFIFRTYADQLGEDRTTIGLNTHDGLNAAGNRPVIFSTQNGTIQKLKRTYDRMSESNVVSVLGDGDGATRLVEVVFRNTRYDSPWNRREISRAQSGYISEMQTAGEEALNETSAKDIIEFSPMQQSSQLYGLHYNVGDRITIRHRGVDSHKRIIAADNQASSDNALTLTFSDL